MAKRSNTLMPQCSNARESKCFPTFFGLAAPMIHAFVSYFGAGFETCLIHGRHFPVILGIGHCYFLRTKVQH